MQNALLEHSAILLTCNKRKSVLKTNFCLLFEWPLKTGFTVDTVKTVLSDHSKRRPKFDFQDQLSLNAGQKSKRAFCNTFDLHKATIYLSLNAGQKSKRAFCNTFDLHYRKLPFTFKTFVLSIFEWPLKTGFTVCDNVVLSF